MELIEEKIQVIAKEIQEANASPWTITRIIKALGEMKTTNDKKMREKALEMLKELDDGAATIYERFSNMKVYVSKETIEGFNRGYIIKSLLKETNIPRSVAEKITQEVEEQIKDVKISFLTTGLIRELVNARLIGYGFEDIRNNYTRLGEPAYEIKKKIIETPYVGEQVREYNTLLVLPKHARDLHYEGKIFIQDIEGFSQRPFAYSFIAEKKESLEKTVTDSVKKIVKKRKNFCLAPNLYGLTYAVSPFLKNNAQTKRTGKLIREMLKILDKNSCISLEFYTPKILEDFSSYRLKAAELGTELLETNCVVGIDNEYCLKLIKTKGKHFHILNNSKEDYYPLNTRFFSTTQGINLFVDLNLEKIAAEKDFFVELEKVSKEIEKLSQEKKELLANKKYNKEFNIEEMKTGIGLTNLFKVGENFGEKPVDFAKKTYKELSNLFKEELFFGISSPQVLEKFSRVTKKEIFSQETLDFEECLSSKKCCFTGKTGTTKEVNELINKKIKQIEFFG